MTRTLPAVSSNPINFGGDPTCTATAEDAARLSGVREGAQFTWRGRHYLCTTTPTITCDHGYITVQMSSCVADPAMASGWALGDARVSVTVDDVQAAAEHLDSYFADCERDGQGISTKETAMRRRLSALLMAGA